MNKDAQLSLRPRAKVKKATLSSNPRWTRSRGEHKKKKQFIVANWGGLGLGNGLGLGLTGVAADGYGAGLAAGLGTGYGAGAYGTGLSTGLSTDYGAGVGTMLATGYGTAGANTLGSNAVLDARHNFGTNYGDTTSNSQGQTALSDLSAAGLSSLSPGQTGGNSYAGLNSYVSNLAGGGNSLNSISSYQNNGLDVLGGNAANTASTGLTGLDSLTGGLSQSQQYGDGNDNLVNSLEEKLNMGGGGRQGIGGGCRLQF